LAHLAAAVGLSRGHGSIPLPASDDLAADGVYVTDAGTMKDMHWDWLDAQAHLLEHTEKIRTIEEALLAGLLHK